MDAHLSTAPIDSSLWLQKRRAALQKFSGTISAAERAFQHIKRDVFDPALSSTVAKSSSNHIETSDPLQDVARADLLIIPNGTARRWSTHRVFNPDAIFGVSALVSDSYIYTNGVATPTGALTLSVSCRCWGSIGNHEQARLNSLPGVNVEIGLGSGFESVSSDAHIRCEPDSPVSIDQFLSVFTPIAQRAITLDPPRAGQNNLLS